MTLNTAAMRGSIAIKDGKIILNFKFQRKIIKKIDMKLNVNVSYINKIRYKKINKRR